MTGPGGADAGAARVSHERRREIALATVRAFLACSETQDFSTAATLLDEQMARVGPDGDVKHGRAEYLAYLDSVLGDVREYRYELKRAVASEAGEVVLVEIDEWLVESDGSALFASEAMIFDVGPDGRIVRLSVFAKSP